MKPDWDKLTKEYEGSASVLIADVDCTVPEGKTLCTKFGVRGYPTIKSGDPTDLKDYKGGRKFKDLLAHAQSLGPTCGPANLDLCDGDTKRMIEEFLALDHESRGQIIKERDEAIAKLEAEHKVYKEKIDKEYRETVAKKEEAVEAIKATSHFLMKEVHDHVTNTMAKPDL
mmetsp:Transcript_609/g.1639  ORF Transcript_609/g.1639 Transcript_609/m.1639 type:complete len:171 (-) Transcript_609:135-647(-)